MAFDPNTFPTLIDLSTRLRELAGDAAYKAGRDYLKKGLVKSGAVSPVTGSAVVTGSTDYRVSIGLVEERVTCTCPAHRRNKHCKHVVAVVGALLERPGEFQAVEAPPEVAPKTSTKSKAPRGGDEAAAPKPTRKRQTKADVKVVLQSTGLETVDQLLAALADGGQLTLSTEKAALLQAAGDLVQGLKLRRLGNLIHLLQRRSGDDVAFSRILQDLWLTRAAVGAHLGGDQNLDPALAEELLGKTWREADLETTAGLDLIEVALERETEGNFTIETSYLADLATSHLFLDRQITPVQVRSMPKAPQPLRLLVDRAGLYPGAAPRRIKLLRARRAPLTPEHVSTLIERAPTSVATLQRQLAERLGDPFSPPSLPVLLRPAALVQRGDEMGALDQTGAVLPLLWPADWTKKGLPLLPAGAPFALFGHLSLREQGPILRPLSILSAALRWENGPLFPEVV